MSMFNILSLNCNGIADGLKRKDVFDRLRKLDCNIYMLQETHLKESEETYIRSGWGYQVILAGNSSNAGGTAILFKNNFEYSISRVLTDPNGQYIIIEIKFMNKTFTLVNLYGPSRGDNEIFFENISRLLEDFDDNQIIMGGDFNCVLDLVKDRKNHTTFNSRPRSRAKIFEIMGKYNLTDIFRHLHPDKESYTWCRFNSTIQARLDFFLVSDDLSNDVKELKVSSRYKSDHAPVILTLNKTSFTRQKTFWKFNNSLLYDVDYVKIVKNVIRETKKEYCNLVYDFAEIDNVPLDEISFQIDDDLFLETLLMKIRGETIAYASRKKKLENLREKELEQQILDHEKVLNNDNLQELHNLKQELQTIRETKIQGMVIRSKANWINQGERVSKYFFNLENRNYTEKMIPQVETDEGNILSKQNEIKTEVYNFYKQLYCQKEVNDFNFDSITVDSNKLAEEEKNSLESNLDLEEIKYAVSNMSSNKSPGPDGFTAEFIKFFFSDIGMFILRSANTGFCKGTLSPSMRQGNIVLIPKENKPKRYIKNLRPISLLSTIYKIISACIANRMKQVLPSIIGDTQNAFIQGRNISSNYRFIYDTLVYTHNNDIPGMLLSIDFEKAFDSISWAFMFKAFEYFNFGPGFMKWIRTLYSNISSCVSINGQYTDWFQIERGVRQGDPSSAYLYLVCAEILSLMIKSNNQIKGIQMNNNVNLLSQFADDTTLSLDGSEESLQQAIKTITDFSRISGLKINESKTMIIWIGARKGSNIRYLRDRNYVWDPGVSFKICGINFSTNIDIIPELNYNSKLDEIRRLCHKWKKRKITPIGKIAVIKSLFVSKITFLIQNIPDPSDNFIKECEKLLYSYLWEDKPSKISKQTVCKEYSEGGLRMINLRNLITTLKTSWIRKMSYNTLIRNMIENINPEMVNLINYGIEYSKNLYKTVTNPFWKDVLKHFIIFQENCKPVTTEEKLSDHIFYNPNITRDNKSIFIKEFADNNILYVHQILNDNNSFMNYQEFKNKHNWCQINFLVYAGIVNAIRDYTRTLNMQLVDQSKAFCNKIVKNLKLGNKNVQKLLNASTKLPTAIEKWNKMYNNMNWNKVFSIIYMTTQDVQLRWFQYRLIHRILPTQRYLYLRKLSNDPICNLCNESEQDICHLFFDCPIVLEFWSKLEDLLKDKCLHCRNIRISQRLVMFGYLENFVSDTVFDYIILIGKFFLYKCKLNDQIPTIEHFILTLKGRYKIERYVATIREKKEVFNKNWLLYNDIVK